MNVLILGGNGMLGPWVIRALEGRHRLRITDVNDLDTHHEYRKLDVSSLEGVMSAAEGMDAVINLSVLRWDRRLAFDVNTRGNYNMMAAAVRHGIRRIVNTGPQGQLAGPTYRDFDFDLNPDMPAQPGTALYPITKSLGQEICRVFSERHDIYVQTLLYVNMYDPATLTHPGGRQPLGGDLAPFSVAWPDAGEVVRCALEIDLAKLPTRCENYFVFGDLPHGKYTNRKTRARLDWWPRYSLERLWSKPRDEGRPGL